MQINVPATTSIEALVEASNQVSAKRITYPQFELYGVEIDLSDWSRIPEGFFMKAFVPNVDEAHLVFPERQTRLRVHLEAQPPAYMGIWFNRRGFPDDTPREHIALEPSFGSSDSIPNAVPDSLLRLEAGETARWVVQYIIDEATL